MEEMPASRPVYFLAFGVLTKANCAWLFIPGCDFLPFLEFFYYLLALSSLQALVHLVHQKDIQGHEAEGSEVEVEGVVEGDEEHHQGVLVQRRVLDFDGHFGSGYEHDLGDSEDEEVPNDECQEPRFWFGSFFKFILAFKVGVVGEQAQCIDVLQSKNTKAPCQAQSDVLAEQQVGDKPTIKEEESSTDEDGRRLHGKGDKCII